MGNTQSGVKSRLLEIKEHARKRGQILLRCPFCRHYLVGIISSRGDRLLRTGERANLYCCWPDCEHNGKRWRVRDAVKGRGPNDGSKCCIQAARKI